MKALCTALCLCATPALAGCLDAPDPCETPLGAYHLTLPAGEGPFPAVMFLHGAGGSGAGAMRMSALVARGYAVIGPNGMDRPGRFATGWSFHPDRPQLRDELAFVREVAADVAAHYNIDRAQILLAGFSIGGSMTSYIACAAPDTFAAYAPVAGSFWRPHPTDCNGPVRLLHTHGWRDVTVPLEGRPLGGGVIEQGDVWHAMLLWRSENQCTQMRPDAFETIGDFWVRRWEDCTPGSALEFALHPGAHGIPRGWSDLALDWFEGLE